MHTCTYVRRTLMTQSSAISRSAHWHCLGNQLHLQYQYYDSGSHTLPHSVSENRLSYMYMARMARPV